MRLILSLICLLFLMSCENEECINYFDNGKVSKVFKCNNKGIKTGLLKEYDKEGKLLKVLNYNLNKLNGLALEFNEVGDTLNIFNFKDDKKDGLQIEFENGYRKNIYNCRNDSLEGEYFSYFTSGKLMFKSFNKGEKKIGECWSYEESGEIDFYSFYNNEGELNYRLIYENDSIIKKEGYPFLIKEFSKDSIEIDENQHYKFEIVKGPIHKALNVKIIAKTEEGVYLVDSIINTPSDYVELELDIKETGVYVVEFDFSYNINDLKIKKKNNFKSSVKIGHKVIVYSRK